MKNLLSGIAFGFGLVGLVGMLILTVPWLFKFLNWYFPWVSSL